MKVRFWGVRGSLHCDPTPKQRYVEVEKLLKDFVASGKTSKADIKSFLSSQPYTKVAGFGSATTCVEVESAKGNLIIDGGTGMRAMAMDSHMKTSLGRGLGTAHIFMTHYHWDHIFGIPFYTPLFIKGNTINFYSVDQDLEKQIRHLFSKPNFPVPFEYLGAEIKFHILEPRKTIQIDDMNITPYQLDHPDPCWGYKIESGGKTYSHCVDSEVTRVTRKELGDDLPLYQDVDLMYFDAQYSESDFPERTDWGHATASRGFLISMRENVKRILFAHHEPKTSWKEISRLVEEAEEYYDQLLGTTSQSGIVYHEVEWEFAYEGLEVDL